VLKEDPQNPRWLFRMAWLLLQQPDPNWRDQSLAVQLARQACESTAYKRRDCLDLLTKALTVNGQTEDVPAIQEKIDALGGR